MGGTQRLLSLFLLLACLQGIVLQQAGTGDPRKPFFERFRRLEEQFRRFQEVTLLRLQEIAGNYNVSYNIDAKFSHLLSKHEGLETVANETQAAFREELRQLKVWTKKLQRKSRQQERRIAAVEESWREREEESGTEKERDTTLLSNLTQEVASQKREGRAIQASVGSLQKVVEGLQDALKNQGSKLDELEQRLKRPEDNEVLLLPGSPLAPAHLLSQPAQAEMEMEAAGGPRPTLKKLQAKHQQRKKLQEESLRLTALSQSRATLSGSFQGQKVPFEGRLGPEAPSSRPGAQALGQPGPAAEDTASEERERVPGPREPGKICNIESMLVFPNASSENFATLKPGFSTELLELSLCTWVSTHANYLGTILSYATEENDNKLVLHGRDAAPRNSIHFVIGDPAFRELPVGRILDGEWHHLCVIWSSIQGRYWFYVDRRLASMGSKFRKGYEIPPSGSLVLGQEQDVPGGGFEPSESFVGFLAGFAVWDRALSPGEVSGVATGNGLPRGAILTLANVSALHGAVRRVSCACLEHCL
uniref:Pentraxin-4 n=1 Tax=Pogona vitticeps TaxID=103695 RepID=A0A6J0UTL4_9SAUR